MQWFINSKLDTTLVEQIGERINIITSQIKSEDIDGLSTRGKTSKQYMLVDYQDKMLDIINGIKQVVIEEMKERNLETGELKFKNCWTVYGEKGGYHLLHRHQNSDDGSGKEVISSGYSVVLYLSTVEATREYPGVFYFAMGSQKGVQVEQLSPELGSLYIFPNNMWHGSAPQNDGTRQTLNFEFMK